jgi:hypothetical protein
LNKLTNSIRSLVVEYLPFLLEVVGPKPCHTKEWYEFLNYRNNNNRHTHYRPSMPQICYHFLFFKNIFVYCYSFQNINHLPYTCRWTILYIFCFVGLWCKYSEVIFCIKSKILLCLHFVTFMIHYCNVIGFFLSRLNIFHALTSLLKHFKLMEFKTNMDFWGIMCL